MSLRAHVAFRTNQSLFKSKFSCLRASWSVGARCYMTHSIDLIASFAAAGIFAFNHAVSYGEFQFGLVNGEKIAPAAKI